MSDARPDQSAADEGGFLVQILDAEGTVISEIGPYPTLQGARARGTIQRRALGGHRVRILLPSGGGER